MSVYSIRVTNNGSFVFFNHQLLKVFAHQLWLGLCILSKLISESKLLLPVMFSNQVMWAIYNWGIKAWSGLSPGGSMDVDLNSHNVISFTAPPPTLSSPTRGGPRGSITINDGPTVPLNEYSVAVGMGHKAIYAVNTGPRLQHNIFTPNPKYWICALRDVDEGQVIDIPTVANKAEVTFPPGVITMSATLHNDYDWDIEPVL